jgi:hypothetical protein
MWSKWSSKLVMRGRSSLVGHVCAVLALSLALLAVFHAGPWFVMGAIYGVPGFSTAPVAAAIFFGPGVLVQATCAIFFAVRDHGSIRRNAGITG